MSVRLLVYDRTLLRVGGLGAPVGFRATLRNQPPSLFEFGCHPDDPAAVHLMTPGARVRVWDGDDYWGSALVRQSRVTGPSSRPKFEFTAATDDRVVQRILGLPVPAGGSGGQNVEYWTRKAPAETVIKEVVGQNLARLAGVLPHPWTVAADQGRGADIDVSLRFHPIMDRVWPQASEAGVAVTVGWAGTEKQGTGFVVDVRVPAAYPLVLTERNRGVLDWEWVQNAPEATRGWAGGAGEGVAREISGPVGPTGAAATGSTPAEVEWGDVWESFTDARDVDAGDAATRVQRVVDDLAETAASTAVTLSIGGGGVKLSPSAGLWPGDLVGARFGSGAWAKEVTSVVEEITYSESPGSVPSVSATVGDAPPAGVGALVSKVGTALKATRRLGVR